jgi:hypothetical protein
VKDKDEKKKVRSFKRTRKLSSKKRDKKAKDKTARKRKRTARMNRYHDDSKIIESATKT